jgi:uncharacterized YigZ family protein
VSHTARVDSYKTLAAGLELEIPKIKGSRFIASIDVAEDEADAMAHIAGVRKEHHAARHVCWAWRTGEAGAVSRSSDDGEPSGSAGKPILNAILGAELTFVVVAVTRYFGGTKLGVGGLVRAYGGAAAEALGAAESRIVVPKTTVTVTVDYPQMGVLEAFIAREGLRADDSEYGERVTLRFNVPVREAEPLIERLFQASAGRIRGEI